jgi:hypothetical protein
MKNLILVILLSFYSLCVCSQNLNKDTIVTNHNKIIYTNINSITENKIKCVTISIIKDDRRQTVVYSSTSNKRLAPLAPFDNYWQENSYINTNYVKSIRLSSRGINTPTFDSTLSIKDNLIKIKSEPKEIANSMYLHHKEYKAGLTYTIIGSLVSISGIMTYQLSTIGYRARHLDLEPVGYLLGGAGAIMSTVGVIMMIDSDKHFSLRLKL